MVATSAPVAGPPPELIVRPRVHLRRDLARLWRDRELVRTVAERDLRARYKQSWFGPAWALVTPLLTVGVFTIVFKRIGRVETGDVPYPLFAAAGLLPWQLFQSGVAGASGSLVFNNSILNKVRCAREVFPLATLSVAFVDFALASLVLGGMFAWYGRWPEVTALWVPVLLVVQAALMAGLSLALAGAVVYVRDVRQVLGGVLQVGLFLTPVAWAIDEIPRRWQVLYCTANPMGALVDGYRRAVVLGQAPDWRLVGPAAATSVAVLAAGYAIFRRLEPGLADVA